MKLKSFKDLFAVLLSDLFILEQKVIEVFPVLITKAHSKELKELLKQHLFDTKEQLLQTEKIFHELGSDFKPLKVESFVKNLFTSLEGFLKENSSSALLDAAIIAIVQKIEHIEIATYGTLREYADIIDLPEAKSYLKASLKEDKRTDALLNKLAKGQMFVKGINALAARK